MDGTGALGGATNEADDAVTVMPTPDNSMSQDSSYSRPEILDDSPDTVVHPATPLSKQKNSLLPPPTLQSSQSSSRPSQPMSPPPSNQHRLPPLPTLPPLSPPHYIASQNQNASWSQVRSPTTSSSAPSNPFYSSSSTTYRSTTPPLPSSAEDSPLVSPAKRFSSGEVKSPFSPTSPRTTLNEEDRAKFAQLATQLKTRLTYAAIKVENGWEKHSFSQIQNLLNEDNKPPQPRRRSNTVQELAPPFPEAGGQLTYESFWANHSRRQSTSQPPASQPAHHHATFPRRVKPDRLSLTAARSHTARDQSAAEIMIALASPRTRSEFSSPERRGEETDEEVESPTRKVKKRDVQGLGIHA